MSRRILPELHETTPPVDAGPEYIVGNARLWIDGEAFEPGSTMTAIGKISPPLLSFYLAGGHLKEVSE